MPEAGAALAVRGMAGQGLRKARLRRRRRALQVGFFALFLFAPALDLLRFDLHETQLWVLGCRWSLGIDDFMRGEISATQAALNIVWRAILPALALVAAFLTVAWRYGRLYCGWLCPHFSLVESLNGLLQRASGKLSLWDRHRTLRAGRQPDARWWPAFLLACAVFGFLWAITLLTYLLPPREIWGNLFAGTLSPNQARFIVVGTLVFTLELMFARHLFCRFGCAVGLFQSLAWMANPRGLVVAFDRGRARDCRSCATADAPGGSACDVACPMRLAPRNIKRMMFSCVQCGRCLTACESSHEMQGSTPNLEWKVGLDAVRETLRQRREDRG
ncbi:4Fe-4S binding protein [uncultured Piscinibacter sp.]|uniref:4Fe-4S binding protein n=1 Tax=uncultured Piscinibacter sp. TaxID=1131835 RepID=UPI00261ABE01|nr:4Fe-4S binding protein [uncultured Piscinibacter sp.]